MHADPLRLSNYQYSRKIFYQKKALSMTLFVMKNFFVTTASSWRNSTFVFRKVQKILTFSQLTFATLPSFTFAENERHQKI